MTRFPSPRRLAATLAVLALGLVAVLPTADAQPARPAPDVAARLSRVTSGLALTPDQQTRLDALASRTTAEPGASWSLASDLKAILTPAQIARLQQASAARRADGDRADRSGGRRGDRAQGSRRGDRRGDRAQRGDQDRAAERPDRPTTEQRAAMREIAEAFRPRQEALVERFRSGTLTAAQFTSQREALRTERDARIDAALTPEQRAARAEREARREAATAAREAALGLTPSQKEALQALKLERLRTAPARTERPARGERPTSEDRAARQAEAMREQAAAILTPDQQALVALHRAVAGGRGQRGRRGGQRRGRSE